MKVAAYTGGPNVPSARLRIRQYTVYLRRYGVNLREYTLEYGKSRPAKKLLQPVWALGTVMQRLRTIPLSYVADLTLFNRHMMPAFIPVEQFTKAPRVLDVDDAIWLTRGGHRCARLAEMCDAIICGNSFLADRFARWNPNVHILPTPVETDLLMPSELYAAGHPVIGWTGTGENLRYVYGIEDSLATVMRRFPDCRLRIISDISPRLTRIPAHQVEFVRWSPIAEVEALRSLSIGIMPLADTDWELGKCSLKMLNYMACAVPVVVSPVGMNNEILALSEVGFAAVTAQDWVDTLSLLLRDIDLATRMGAAGRRITEERFSAKLLSGQLAALLYQAAGKTMPTLAAVQVPTGN